MNCPKCKSEMKKIQETETITNNSSRSRIIDYVKQDFSCVKCNCTTVVEYQKPKKESEEKPIPKLEPKVYYRLLNEGEIIKESDEWCGGSVWCGACSNDNGRNIAQGDLSYRRRVYSFTEESLGSCEGCKHNDNCDNVSVCCNENYMWEAIE